MNPILWAGVIGTIISALMWAVEWGYFLGTREHISLIEPTFCSVCAAALIILGLVSHP